MNVRKRADSNFRSKDIRKDVIRESYKSERVRGDTGGSIGNVALLHNE